MTAILAQWSHLWWNILTDCLLVAIWRSPFCWSNTGCSTCSLTCALLFYVSLSLGPTPPTGRARDRMIRRGRISALCLAPPGISKPVSLRSLWFCSLAQEDLQASDWSCSRSEPHIFIAKFSWSSLHVPSSLIANFLWGIGFAGCGGGGVYSKTNFHSITRGRGGCLYVWLNCRKRCCHSMVSAISLVEILSWSCFSTSDSRIGSSVPSCLLWENEDA